MNEQDLRHLLTLELGWDDDLTQQVINSVKQHAVGDSSCSQAAVNEIVQVLFRPNVNYVNYMTDSMKCQQAAKSFATAYRTGVMASSQNTQCRSSKTEGTTKLAHDRSTASSLPSTRTSKKKPAFSSKSAAQSSIAYSTGQSLTVKKGVVNKGAATQQTDQAHSAVSTFESAVFNCLSCGKVYDFRENTSLALAVIRCGGACTFCSSALPQAAKAVQAAEVAESAERARAFTARLVEYDRTSAQRTAVVDDQGDFFEINSNAWLTPEERANVKRQQVLQERQLRDKVAVTVDLTAGEVWLVEGGCADEHASFVVEEARTQAMRSAPSGGPDTAPPAGVQGLPATTSLHSLKDSTTTAATASASTNTGVALQMRPSVQGSSPPPRFVQVINTPLPAAAAGCSSVSRDAASGVEYNITPQIEGWNDDVDSSRRVASLPHGGKGRPGFGAASGRRGDMGHQGSMHSSHDSHAHGRDGGKVRKQRQGRQGSGGGSTR